MTRRDLWAELCSYDNLFLVYKHARKHKTLKTYVIEFEKNLKNNLLELRTELLLKSYRPKPLEIFIIRDPKTRKISKSDFRDRIIHHALCNIIEPIFEKRFIHDSYANRIGKGTLKALEQFDHFKRIVSENVAYDSYVLKADIKKYFETVSHNILIQIIQKRIKDKNILWLIRTILNNHKTDEAEKSMPLGNLTSQFFANVYLNELDYYVKHELKIRLYIRYVDDFVILHNDKTILAQTARRINIFLKNSLALELHDEKTSIRKVSQGVKFLGFRIFNYHKMLKKSNIRRFQLKIERLCQKYDAKEVDYDNIYDFLEGWIAYSKIADTYKLRAKIMTPIFEKFSNEISTKEYNRYIKDNA